MQPLVRHTGIAAVLMIPNIDTDTIIPSRAMSRVSREGLGRSLFANWRYRDTGGNEPDPGFVLNQAPFDAASILITDRNFGCGSSREHAVWALADFGFRVLIAPSFGAIFESNCWRNGLLPIALAKPVVDALAERIDSEPVTVDLERCRIEPRSGEPVAFEVPAARRADLLAGNDAIDQTLAEHALIDAARQRRDALIPWATADQETPP